MRPDRHAKFGRPEHTTREGGVNLFTGREALSTYRTRAQKTSRTICQRPVCWLNRVDRIGRAPFRKTCSRYWDVTFAWDRSCRYERRLECFRYKERRASHLQRELADALHRGSITKIIFVVRWFAADRTGARDRRQSADPCSELRKIMPDQSAALFLRLQAVPQRVIAVLNRWRLQMIRRYSADAGGDSRGAPLSGMRFIARGQQGDTC